MLTAYSTQPRPNCLPENEAPELPDTFEALLAAMADDAKKSNRAARKMWASSPGTGRAQPLESRIRVGGEAHTKIMRALGGDRLTARQVGEILGMSQNTTSNSLIILFQRGELDREGLGGSNDPFRYYVPEESK